MVTKEHVTQVAKLAKLSFEEHELTQLTSELNSVLGYIDQLSELDVTDVPPLENINESVQQNALRSDEVIVSLPREAALKNAPSTADGYFLVPKVLTSAIKEKVPTALPDEEEDDIF